MTNTLLTPEKSELGKKASYDSEYDSTKLFPIPRQTKRDEIGVPPVLPFYGFDVWNHYEVSWLNEKGKPVVALAEIIYGCDTKFIIESKSMKLYFNTFNNTKFTDQQTLENVIRKDLSSHLQTSSLHVRIIPIPVLDEGKFCNGICLDDLDIECTVYRCEPNFLQPGNDIVEESVYSHLLKSNCLVTNQPDWNSVCITYRGPKIHHEGLLRYIVSFRNDNEFHEQCIEKIFMHIMEYCKPFDLTVYGRSTRRGGLDINSYRSTKPINPSEITNVRLSRQ